MKITPPDIERYVEKHCTPESLLLQSLVKETYSKTEYPQMLVGRIEGSLLRILTRSIQAKRVLEVGTFTGYSALCFAESVPVDGEVITCDIDPENTKIARHYWEKSPHGRKIRLMLAPALDTIPILSGSFDLAFIDADKVNYPAYFELIAPKIRSGGLLIIDNVLWSGSVIEPDPDEDTKAIMKVSEMIANDPRFETSMLSVRDGMLVAYKK